MASGQPPHLFHSATATRQLILLPFGARELARDDMPVTLLTLPQRGFYERHGKRILDLVLGSILLVALLPLIAAVALAVLVTSGRPVFYASERMGRNRHRFLMWKFRTMVIDADDVFERWKLTHPELASELSTNWRLEDDPRRTPLGRFLRKSSLDELPQFWNVLRGEMSLVGPRPYLARESIAPLLSLDIHAVKPGLTGPFQVRGRKGLGPTARMEIEAGYVSELGLTGDLRYVARTVQPLIKMDGH
ncbi:MAG: sugar transferase [Chloroflexi bacterium]|nr:sugar transferase [Chloroflexota bacterium]